MSYARLTAFGEPNPAIIRPAECVEAAESGGAGIGSRGISYCIGYAESCPHPDYCCPPETWYTRVYREIIGDNSTRAIAEQKVRRAQGLLLHPVGTESGLERWAYDHSGVLPEGLEARIAESFMLFESCFPLARWKWDPDDVKTDSCGDFGGWDENRTYYPDARIRALEVLSGVRFSPSFVAKLRAEGLQAPPSPLYQPRPGRDPLPGAPPPAELRRALDAARSVIEAVPGARPDDVVDQTYVFMSDGAWRGGASPGSGLRQRQPVHDQSGSDLVQVLPNGQVVPTPWLKDFLLVFQPAKTAEAGTVLAPRPGPPRQRPKGGAAVLVPRADAAPPTPGVDEARARPLLLAAGAMVVGVGVYVFVRMARW